MPDKIETIGRTIIHHGPASDRVYVMSLSRKDGPDIVDRIDALAKANGYSKIFAKAPAGVRDWFERRGYRVEAKVPGFFGGQEDGLFMARFMDNSRAIDHDAERTTQVLATAGERAGQSPPPNLPDDWSCRPCTPTDTPEMAKLFATVFQTYPFPIHDPAYLARTMEDHAEYFGVWRGEQFVGVSSAEMYAADKNVEMTDFAVLPEMRARGLASFLLDRMEQVMSRRGFRTAYTIARAPSFGMNITFARGGYRFAGTLVNNTNIAGGFESMNVWFKPL